MNGKEFTALDDEWEALEKDAIRYRWLKSRKWLELRSDSGIWARPDGTRFAASHYLSEGDTQHAPAPTLDEAIDAAMQPVDVQN